MKSDNTISRIGHFSYNTPCIPKKTAYNQINTLDITYAYTDVCQSMRLSVRGKSKNGSLAGKPASENPANSVKPKSGETDTATPSKEHVSVLCVETLHGAPKA